MPHGDRRTLAQMRTLEEQIRHQFDGYLDPGGEPRDVSFKKCSNVQQCAAMCSDVQQCAALCSNVQQCAAFRNHA